MPYFRLSASVSVIALLSTTAVFAADAIQPIYDAPMMAADDGFDWSGFYVGVFAGGAMGNSDSIVHQDTLNNPDDTIGELTDDFEVSGSVLGLTAGYNMNVGAFVLGVEGDIGWSNASGSIGYTNLDDMGTPLDLTDDVLRTNEITTDYGWISTFRGRLGTASGPAMVFVTGGLAAGGVNDAIHYSDDQGGENDISDDSALYGWTAGAGIEAAVTDNATIKVEYQYVDLGDRTVQTGDYWGNVESEFTVSHSLHIVKAGLNWQFD